jgi:hypothetical protein
MLSIQRCASVMDGAVTLRRVASALILVAALALAGCQVRLISDYDPQVDAAVMQLHRKVEAFLLQIQAAAASTLPEAAIRRSYAANEAFYRDVQVDLASIRLRAESTPHNDLTIEQIALLTASIEDLRQLHERAGDGGLRPEVITPARLAMQSHFGSIITLELAKQRGE